MPTLPDNIGPTIQLILFVMGAYAFAFHLGLVIWAARDVSSRSRDWLVRLLAVLSVAVFSLPGLLLYFILRPRETLAEAYGRALEEEALLAGVEEQQASCPNCRRRVAQDYMVCPNCRSPLKNPCRNCGRLLNPGWELCPYCGTEQFRASRSRSSLSRSYPPDEATNLAP